MLLRIAVNRKFESPDFEGINLLADIGLDLRLPERKVYNHLRLNGDTLLIYGTDQEIKETIEKAIEDDKREFAELVIERQEDFRIAWEKWFIGTSPISQCRNNGCLE